MAQMLKNGLLKVFEAVSGCDATEESATHASLGRICAGVNRVQSLAKTGLHAVEDASARRILVYNTSYWKMRRRRLLLAASRVTGVIIGQPDFVTEVGDVAELVVDRSTKSAVVKTASVVLRSLLT